MSAFYDSNGPFLELLQYFASYLRDMNDTITQVKALTYTLINLPQPKNNSPIITANIPSIMTACKKTYEDIKRAESILKGHVRGSRNEELSDGQKTRMMNRKNTGITISQYPSSQSLTKLSRQLKADFISNGFENLRKTQLKQAQKSRICQEETKSTYTLNRDLNEKRLVQKQEEQHYFQKNIQSNKEQLAQNKKEQSKIVFPKLASSRSEQCLSIISKIRKQLYILQQ